MLETHPETHVKRNGCVWVAKSYFVGLKMLFSTLERPNRRKRVQDDSKLMTRRSQHRSVASCVNEYNVWYLWEAMDVDNGTWLQTIGEVADRITEESREVYPTNPANHKSEIIGEGAAQAVGMMAGAGAVRALGASAKIAGSVPLIMGAAMGTGEGVDAAKELGVEDPYKRLAMGLLFGGV